MTKEHIDTIDSTVSIDNIDIGGIAPGSLPFPKPKRDTKDVSTISDHAKRKGLKILDPGNVSFSGIYIPSDLGQQALINASEDDSEHTIQVKVPEAGLIFEYQAYVSTEYPDEEDESTLIFNCELECTGGFLRSTSSASVTSIVASGDDDIVQFPGTITSETDNLYVFYPSILVSISITVNAPSATSLEISNDNCLTYDSLSLSNPVFSIDVVTDELNTPVLRISEENKATRIIRICCVPLTNAAYYAETVDGGTA